MILRNLISKILNQFSNFDSSRSSQWSKVRKKYLEKHPTCEACGRDDDIEVHHITPVHVNPEKELDETNLISLCGKYSHFTFGHLMDWKSWNVNVREDAESYHNKIKNRPYIDG